MQNKKAIVIFSGGQDSTTCLLQALQTYGNGNVEAITFHYGQRHSIELDKSRWIANDLGVKQTILDLSLMQSITHNALMDNNETIQQNRVNYPILLSMVVMRCFCSMRQSMPKVKGLAILLPVYVKPILAVILIVVMSLLNQ